MNKSDLIAALAKKEKIPETIAVKIVSIIFDGFTAALNNGGRIEIRDFGSLVVRKYGGYTGRNPRTGKKVKIGPKKLPFFKAGKELREMINS